MCVNPVSYNPAGRDNIVETVLVFNSVSLSSSVEWGITGQTFDNTILFFLITSGLVGRN